MNKLILVLMLLMFGLYIHLAQDVKSNFNRINEILNSEVKREVVIYQIEPKYSKPGFGRIVVEGEKIK